MGDEGGPLGIGLQDLISNYVELLWLRVMVVSVNEKASMKTSCMQWKDERKSTADDISKSNSTDIKTEQRCWLGTSPDVTCLRVGRCPVWRQRESISGSYGERGNLSPR